MRVMVLGGDGFCGWPTALHLAARNHAVMIVDNLSRRHIDNKLGVRSLTPISSISDRVACWNARGAAPLRFEHADVARKYGELRNLLEDFLPEAVIHFAEQRSAPYSMRSAVTKRYTVNNNINATNNLLCALVEIGLDANIVHLGTMGVYGYGTVEGMEIPEGYLKVTMQTDAGPVTREILHPTNPGSLYHTTKVLDQSLFAFYAKNDGLQITDLHQGIVWGTQTDETKLDPALINRFDYDGDYGTVLNRFLMQAAIGHPLTVHGTGGQTRAFIHIKDSVRCIELAMQNGTKRGDRVRILNQMTEVHRIRDLAALVARKTGAAIEPTDNPRKEAAENDLAVCNDTLRALGLKPTLLEEGLMMEIRDIALTYRDRVDRSKIAATARWVQP